MLKIEFPEGKRIFNEKTYSREFLELTLAEIRGTGEFTGYLQAEKDNSMSILFFLKSRPYAAGSMDGFRPSGRSIRDFFEELSKNGRERVYLSLREIDPVLFKGMLVYLQRDPDIKASAAMLDFDEIIGDIQKKEAGAVIILQKENKMNFFFFLNGEPVKAHFAGTSDADIDRTLPLAEQLTLCAYPKDLSRVDALVYLNIATSQAADAEEIKEAELTDILYKEEDAPEPLSLFRVDVAIVEIPGHERRLTVSLPCGIGRKEGAILLADNKVSGRHAVLRESGGKLLIEDLDSTNGTYVNDVEIKARELLEGDVISVGETRIRVENIMFPES